MRVWMLTGDKGATALEIGYNCGLLQRGSTDLFQVVESTDESKIRACFSQYFSKTPDKYSIAIAGSAMKSVISLPHRNELRQTVIKSLIEAETVVLYRSSPADKSDIVKLIRQTLPDMKTLAIGDGANDVNMI